MSGASLIAMIATENLPQLCANIRGTIYRQETVQHSSCCPKSGSFTQCAIHQYTHRAEVLFLSHICADMGARW